MEQKELIDKLVERSTAINKQRIADIIREAELERKRKEASARIASTVAYCESSVDDALFNEIRFGRLWRIDEDSAIAIIQRNLEEIRDGNSRYSNIVVSGAVQVLEFIYAKREKQQMLENIPEVQPAKRRAMM